MLAEVLPLCLLLAFTALVLCRLPQAHRHTFAFRRRRFFNWALMGLTYAFLYMGRYNITVSKNALGELMTNDDFGMIFFWGTLTYGCAFALNGPLADRWGGRRTMLISAAGAAVMNAALGGVTWGLLNGKLAPVGLLPLFSVLYAGNMYFQSFGVVSIIKVNAAWFHLRERGSFGGIFGILIALGMYFAFDWGRIIADHLPPWWLFFLPALILSAFFFLCLVWVRDLPSDAGHPDFETADATGEGRDREGVVAVARRMVRNPVIVTIAAIEFCSGFLRNAVMHWYVIFAKQTGVADTFVAKHWGILLCAAGIVLGVLGGAVSDHVFGARRGPVAVLLYSVMAVAAGSSLLLLDSVWMGWVALCMSACVIGIHSILSGTASMDFGGRHNVGVAVGIIDGLVYLGTAAQALLFGKILPEGQAAHAPANWFIWPLTMFLMSLLGLSMALRLWHARPEVAKGGPLLATVADLTAAPLRAPLGFAEVSRRARMGGMGH